MAKMQKSKAELAMMEGISERILIWELEIENPYLKYIMDMFASRYKSRDISLLTWFLFLGMVPEFGFPFVWICLGNLLATSTLQYFYHARRPIDYIPELYNYYKTDPDTMGFPSLESHMAVVVVVPIIAFCDKLSIKCIFFGYILFVGFTRVYVSSRFPSQVIGSWGTGIVGLLLGNHGHFNLKEYHVPRYVHHIMVVVIAICVALVLSLWIENNESRMIGVPRKDFVNVISGILNTDGNTEALDNSSDTEDDHHVSRKSLRKDSFYYLMRTMQRNEDRSKRTI